MQSLEKKRKDPTPSRFFYRWERLRLTPYFRYILLWHSVIFDWFDWLILFFES